MITKLSDILAISLYWKCRIILTDLRRYFFFQCERHRHTGVVVYGNEYFFGGGIQHAPAGATPYGTPVRVVDLGFTHVPKDLFEEYLLEISPRYTAETYSLISHNCNNFSNEVAQFLVGTTIPDYILQLPNEVFNSPMGSLISELFFSRHRHVILVLSFPVQYSRKQFSNVFFCYC